MLSHFDVVLSLNLSLDRTFKQRLLRLVQRLGQYMINLNLFPSHLSSTNSETLRTELISTRLFIAIFTVTVTILLIYTSAVKNVYTFTHSISNYDEYNHLFSRHLSTLRCPCSRISTSYKLFIEVDFSTHPVCDSMYVTDQWIRSIIGDTNLVWYVDFRVTGTYQFLALQHLCKLVVALITDQIEGFYSKTYTSIDMAPKELHTSHAKTAIQQFIADTEKTFKLSLRTINDVTQANAIISALMQNYAFKFIGSIHVTTAVKRYQNGCFCSVRSDCVNKSGIQSLTSGEIWYIPEFYFGCLIVESLRQSRFDCFFDQTCLDELKSHLLSSLSMDLIPLNSSALNQFRTNSTVGQIVDKLMISEWR